MSILKPETNLYPDNLLADYTNDLVGAGSWWVLHTRPRAEKAVARRCLVHKLPFYLPLELRRWKRERRLFKSYVPLFPGYVFLHGDCNARLKALETNLVAQVLHVPDQKELHADLKRVERVIASGSAICSESRLQPGSLIVIAQGPLAGLEGKVLRHGKNWRFVVEVRFLQQSVSVEVEAWMIEALRVAEPPASVSA